MYLAWAMPFTVLKITTHSSSVTQASLSLCSWLRKWWLEEGESLFKVTQRADGEMVLDLSSNLLSSPHFTSCPLPTRINCLGTEEEGGLRARLFSNTEGHQNRPRLRLSPHRPDFCCRRYTGC